MVRSDHIMLEELSSQNLKSIRLQGQLQNEMQESRHLLLEVILSPSGGRDLAPEIDAIRRMDISIASTESQIAQLGVATQSNQKSLFDSWQHFVGLRDQMLTRAAVSPREPFHANDTEIATESFRPVEQALQQGAAAIEASSGARIQQISENLRQALRDFLLSTIVKIAVLVLLVWTDWKRARIQSQLQRATRDLKVSEDRFSKAYETAVVGMAILKLDGTVISANAKAAEILGYEVSEVIGMKISDIMAPECVDEHRQQFSALPHSAESSYQAERRVVRKDGSFAWVRNSVTLLKPEGQEPQYFTVTEEITSQRKANDRLAFLANYDPTTGLGNRQLFEQQLAAALASRTGSSDCAALLYLEIDSFDFLKGTFGRNVADEVLSELGVSLSAFRREGEILGRLDDSAFGMIVLAAPYDEATMVRATELREILHRAGESGKHRIPLSASIGIAYSDHSGVSWSAGSNTSLHGSEAEAETLLKFARAAMLEARSRGGDSICITDPSLQERAAQRHQIESALLRGLREDEFRVVFQPQFQVATGNLVRFEALCRWNSSELGPIPPDRFIPIAEQTGLIAEIGRRVLIEALRQAKGWTESGRRIGVAVNISPLQFMRPDFTKVLTEVLSETQFPPALLELEITEGIFIRDLNLAVARIRELQRLGLSIALDDFGTGYSSLSYLQRMPIDAVKLDRSFVGDLTTDPATVSMVRSVLAMAEALNLRVVSEGVETAEQLEILRGLGCEEAQGYLLGRPESAELALRRVLESPIQPVGMIA
jgi:PAS domain S-box-containing protein/diguanylate cyclase (GGDEF)-like protein